MAVTPDRQALVPEAVYCALELTVAPLDGLETVTVANAGSAAGTASIRSDKKREVITKAFRVSGRGDAASVLPLNEGIKETRSNGLARTRAVKAVGTAVCRFLTRKLCCGRAKLSRLRRVKT